jgi:HEAT repeat protein
MDVIYRLDLAFPHSANVLQLVFQSPGPPQDTGDESWGLDNIRVEALAEAPGKDLNDAVLEQLCRHLLGTDPVLAHRAVWKLIGAGNRIIPALRTALALPAVDPRQIDEAIALLHDPQWTVRQEAAKTLKRLGPAIKSRLQEALKQSLPTETQIRIREVIASFNEDDPNQPDALRYARLFRILDVLNSAQAAELLGTMAAEAPVRSIREAAKASRQRILKTTP